MTKYKLIILIIASHTMSIYDYCIDVWKKYMNTNKDIKSFLIYCNPTQDEDIIIKDDEIFVKAIESYVPGIFLKTMKSIEYINKTYEYDFLLRTNMSTFFIFPKLLNYLDNISQINFIGGHSYIYIGYNPYITFIQGDGILISSDIGKQMVTIELDNNMINTIPDDVYLGYILGKCFPSFVHIPRSIHYELLTDQKEVKEINIGDPDKSNVGIFTDDIFRIRVKNVNRELDKPCFNLLLKKYYDIDMV